MRCARRLPAAKLPTLDTVRPSDDPEELLEQADLLRDNEEKLRRELKTLEARIAERRDEAELDRRVQRFMGEESMFDDSDRRLRVQRTVTTPASADAFTSGAATETRRAARRGHHRRHHRRHRRRPSAPSRPSAHVARPPTARPATTLHRWHLVQHRPRLLQRPRHQRLRRAGAGRRRAGRSPAATTISTTSRSSGSACRAWPVSSSRRPTSCSSAPPS